MSFLQLILMPPKFQTRFSARVPAPDRESGTVELKKDIGSRRLRNREHRGVLDSPLPGNGKELFPHTVNLADQLHFVLSADLILQHHCARKKTFTNLTEGLQQCAVVKFAADQGMKSPAVQPGIQSSPQRRTAARQQQGCPVQ